MRSLPGLPMFRWARGVLPVLLATATLAVAAPEPTPEELAATWVRRITRAEVSPVQIRSADPAGFRLGRAVDGGPIRREARDGYGIGTRTGCDLTVSAAAGLRKFVAVAVVDQQDAVMRADSQAAPVIFSIEADGKEVWRSEPTVARMEARKFGAEFPAGTTAIVLRARTTDAAAVPVPVAVDWAEAEVELGDGRKVLLGDPDFSADPFSFVYQGRSSAELLPTWRFTQTERAAPGERVHELTWRDPATGLECRMELRAFTEFPALEWVLHFRNAGTADTPILEDVQALAAAWQGVKREGALAVYHSRGSDNHIEDYAYERTLLFARDTLALGADDGRSSRRWLPFFATDLGRFGVMTGIGWTGQWRATVDRTAGTQLRILAGMERTHLKLHPGEEIRTPRIMQLLWRGDRLAAHNQLRRFLLAHHSPQSEGKPVTPPFSFGNWGGTPTAEQLALLARARAEGIAQDTYWVDAGWYGPKGTEQDWSEHVGDWRVNPRLHPQGLRPLADAAAAAGMKFLLWVEPERAIRGTPWQTEHPDWFIGYKERVLLNLGHPAAWAGAVELLSTLIRENRVAVFRDDLNMNCLEELRGLDPADRQGIGEIKYVTGLYAFWDELRARHPGLLIDNCGSGGMRIDLETISRSVALWRSDFQCDIACDPRGSQNHGMGLSHWLPLHGTGAYWTKPPAGVPAADWERYLTYRLRSAMGPSLVTAPTLDPEFPWAWWRKMGAEYLRARPLFTGDYYPLTEFVGTDANSWAAYQMHRVDLGAGCLFAFRRKDAPWSEGTFALRGLEAARRYRVEDADSGRSWELTGRELAAGLKVALPAPESSALLFYTLVPEAPARP